MRFGEGQVGGNEVSTCAFEDDPAASLADTTAVTIDDPVGVHHDRVVVPDNDDRLVIR